jgi:hypothetical protein
VESLQYQFAKEVKFGHLSYIVLNGGRVVVMGETAELSAQLIGPSGLERRCPAWTTAKWPSTS